MKKKTYIVWGLCGILLICISCSGLLDENMVSDRTTDNYYVDEQGFEDLVKANYASLRNIHKERELVLLGTDIFTQSGHPDLGGLFGMNEYSPQGLNVQSEAFDTYWKLLYSAIGVANTAIERAANVDMNEATKTIRLGEVKFLRAMYYFYLVEQFGDIPLVLDEITSVVTTAERIPEQEIYRQILADLTQAVDVLPGVQGDYGRVTKGAAQHLLSKVYLTRAYKGFAEGTDFQRAVELAESIINSGNYRLLDTFREVFQQGNEVNDEIIFSVQYSNNTVVNGAGSNAHSIFGAGIENLEGMDRNSVYNRQQARFVPSRYLHTLFDVENDERYDVTFLRVFYATIDQGSKSVGDTVLYFPRWDEPWSQDRIDAADYIVVNWEEYYMNAGKTNQFPPIWKFFEADLPYGDDMGTRDQFVFRLAETHLLAAEAYLGLNNPSEALRHINIVRRRAAVPGSEAAMEMTSITIDDLLDERARELCGEDQRWNDLKRTNKLIERTLLRNERAAAANQLREFHLLRPIPLSQIERTTNDLIQNPGYN
ncbi:RagB/SusD family nutrient uptake outer membrane protein [Negadavirga shengliensis]|uniref:RagB/SusD family nutrient uptake outer membrane protein n=1 Tax=Negadavirga shengliensis TaxID=1389218 RepID=A0ABV9SWR7_9BACT